MSRGLLAFAPLGLWAAAVLVLGGLELDWDGLASLPSGWDKAAHFVMYGVGGLLAAWAGRVRGPRAGLLGLLLVLSTGAADELHQGMLATRQSDFWDWTADGVGAGVVYLVARRLMAGEAIEST
ncbi:MAG: hypothetical protein GWM90_27845 [Gemmatimonadetes bacterium]|nr:hypothetical protein [Gemmatimonadota bacterium]NIQ58829.1 hypothetical protein [Gemmatimonadota bacterium]NIU78998.1 hypothetical protein [Gammaproteobacteria bacterium]NIX47742.1 hypothetical protein [Gemmatimonadota bacterium]NIY12103.1 hypothetical protein [Gemmatimonadota bacterium]